LRRFEGSGPQGVAYTDQRLREVMDSREPPKELDFQVVPSRFPDKVLDGEVGPSALVVGHSWLSSKKPERHAAPEGWARHGGASRTAESATTSNA
jgi:hypothetical protein